MPRDGPKSGRPELPASRPSGALFSMPSVCFVGLENLPVLASEYGDHGAGGAQVQQVLLARALARRGYRVSMVVADYGQPDRAQWHGITTFRAFRHSAGLPVLRFISPRWTSTWSAMRRADADCYYVSCAGMLIAEVSLFARRHGRKTVFRVASDSDCDPRAVLIRHWRDRMLYGHGLRHADLVLAQTHKQQQLLQTHYGRSSLLAKSLADLQGSDLDFPARDVDVLWVSNIQPLKRPDRLLTLARALPHRRFHLIGGPMGAHGSLFEQLRRECETIANLTFHGKVSYHEVHSWFRRARVLVNTSDIEGFPNTYQQAWAHGAPVVAFHDPNGLIASRRLGHAALDDADLARGVESLLADPARWQEASDRCVAFMQERFADGSALAEYESAFRTIGLAPPP